MINIWEYANSLPKVKLETEDGKTYSGKVVIVFDKDETGEEQDSISIQTGKEEIISFFPSDIKSIEIISQRL